MALKECETNEMACARIEAERKLDSLADLRRAAQRMYASQFQAAQDEHTVWSPQQMRAGIALLNLIRTTILDEARLAREAKRDAAQASVRNLARKTRGRKAGNEPLLLSTPEDTASKQDCERAGRETREGGNVEPVVRDFEEDRMLADEVLASGAPGGQAFPNVPGLVAGEVRRIFVNGDLIPDPGPEEARRLRYAL